MIPTIRVASKQTRPLDQLKPIIYPLLNQKRNSETRFTDRVRIKSFLTNGIHVLTS